MKEDLFFGNWLLIDSIGNVMHVVAKKEKEKLVWWFEVGELVICYKAIELLMAEVINYS